MTAEISRAAGPVAARDQAPPPGVLGEGRPGGGTQLRTGSLCSGYEGLGMAVQMVLGGELAWVADNDPGASAVLACRFPSVKNLGDITETDWAAVEPVDILTAGFPCQDVSCAGGRTGLREGNRTGVWAYVALAIDALCPRLVLLENVGGLLSASADSDMEPCPWCLGDSGSEPALRALGAVLGDLAEIGFDADWCCVRASDTGAPHRRERVFIVAWPAADPELGRRTALRVNGALPGTGCTEAGSQPETGRVASALADRSGVIAEDPDRPASRERRLPASGQAESGRTRADAGRPGGVRTADGWPHCPYLADCDAIEESCPDESGRWHIRAGYCTTEPHALCAEDAADAERDPRTQNKSSWTPPARYRPADWGAYEPAIRRWEAVLGRPAPRPTEPGRTGERLTPRFVEWLMGLPEGWVTGVPGLSRNAQLKLLGNGVVPQQAALALSLLLEHLREVAA